MLLVRWYSTALQPFRETQSTTNESWSISEGTNKTTQAVGSCGTPLQVACSKTTQYTCEGSISWHTAPCLLQAQKNTTFIHIAAQQMIPILTIKAENIHHVIVNPPKMQTTIHTVTVLVHSDRVDRFINLVSLLGYLI